MDDEFDEEEDNEDEEEFAEYSPKSEFSKPKIVEMAVQKCLEVRSVEMKEGYFNYKIDKEGNPTLKIWVPDSRKVFISSVEALRNLLSPELKNKTKFAKTEEKLREKINEVFERYAYTEKKRENINGRLVWRETGKKFIPEIDGFVIVQNPQKPSTAIEGKGLWNTQTNLYWNEVVGIYDELFANLNDLINSLNYFKQKMRF